ncbi:MAG: 50S ribosomal protein L35 [Bacilli bacterium]|nr:50S ribosomal protein L35 [Bacilli bacterium]
MAKKIKMKKNKMKTHKGLKKVLNIRQSGSISVSSQGVRHNTGKNSAKRSRQKRKNNVLNNSDFKRVKSLVK